MPSSVNVLPEAELFPTIEFPDPLTVKLVLLVNVIVASSKVTDEPVPLISIETAPVALVLNSSLY